MLGRYGIALLPLLTTAGRAWSAISHYGLLFALAVSVFWMRYGWLGALLWMAVSLAGLGVGVAAMAIEKVRWYMALGVTRGSSERAFIAAYLIYADKLGVSIDCRVPEEEIASGSWRSCLAGYLTKCPQVLRFGGEEHQSLADAEGVGVPGESGDDVRDNHGEPGGAEESEEVVPDWPYAGPRRAWWPPGALSKSWAVVALPPQVTGQITVAEYRELVIDHLVWVAQRDGWTADSLCRYAERMIPDLLYTGELLNCHDLLDAVSRLVTGNRGYEAMCTNGIYSKPMHIEPLPTGAEDAALESSIEGWLDELVPVYRD